MYLYDTYICLNKKMIFLLNIDTWSYIYILRGFCKASLLATLLEQETITEESIKSQVDS